MEVNEGAKKRMCLTHAEMVNDGETVDEKVAVKMERATCGQRFCGETGR